MVDTLCNNIKVLRFVNSPVPSNAYLLIDGSDVNCIVLDPGSKVQNDIRDYIKDKGLNLDYIILTHEHFDHCWGVNYLLDSFPAKVVTTRLCAEWIQTPMNYFNKLYFDSDEMYSISKVDVLAENVGWKINWRGVDVNLIDAKGHTNRSMCVRVGNAIFSGDTMIYNTKPFLKKKYGASLEDLRKTIGEIYSRFEDSTIVYAGHGESFQLGSMKSFYKNLELL
jgi:glyoxylase-like metal-dependent hydrolase (beta-lactamase superfamily II)